MIARILRWRTFLDASAQSRGSTNLLAAVPSAKIIAKRKNSVPIVAGSLFSVQCSVLVFLLFPVPWFIGFALIC
jgi:hypothetical protein